MKNKKTFRVVFLVSCFTIFSLPSFAGQFTLSTYYPAPFGSYDRLKLVPRDSMPLDPNCDDNSDLGIMYFDNGKAERTEGIYVCQKVSSEPDEFKWILMGGVIPVAENKEGEKEDEEPLVDARKVACVGKDGRLGVCLNNPSADGTCACHQGSVKKSEK